jgi:hypothetical protein
MDRYEIRVAGHLDQRRAHALGCDELRLPPDGDSPLILAVWRPLAVAVALVSATGIVLFFETWPIFNTLAALGAYVAVLVTVLWLHWPPQATLGT